MDGRFEITSSKFWRWQKNCKNQNLFWIQRTPKLWNIWNRTGRTFDNLSSVCQKWFENCIHALDLYIYFCVRFNWHQSKVWDNTRRYLPYPCNIEMQVSNRKMANDAVKNGVGYLLQLNHFLCMKMYFGGRTYRSFEQTDAVLATNLHWTLNHEYLTLPSGTAEQCNNYQFYSKAI